MSNERGADVVAQMNCSWESLLIFVVVGVLWVIGINNRKYIKVIKKNPVASAQLLAV